MTDRVQELTADCVHCGACTRRCAFLKKYSLDLAAFAERPELGYHCFLCGECAAVCPRGIDGRAISLALRRGRVSADGGKVTEGGYGALLAEKRNYLFRNYRRGKTRTVLFTGCNFPSFFPRTTDRLIEQLGERGIGVIFDCCGKPISELGLEKESERGLAALKRRLQEAGAEELVMLCPNCYYYLKPRLKEFRLVSVYDKLRELGLGKEIGEKAQLFVPCPDRASRELEKSFLPFLTAGWEEIAGAQCCGLGGCAAGKEPELAKGFRAAVKAQATENIYAYCASCAGCLSRGGVENVHHVLAEILDTGEKPVIGGTTLWNRARRVF